MSNEDIIKEIDEATDLMRETKKKVNEALNKARAVVNREQPTISEDTLEMERMKALNEGRNEVWELAKKIAVEPENGGYDSMQLHDIFGFSDMDLVFTRYSPQEALAKLEAYEKEKATFKRGNIVLFVDTDELGIYIGQYADGMHAVVFDECNVPQKVSTEEIRKTDKHIDIQSVLEGDNK